MKSELGTWTSHIKTKNVSLNPPRPQFGFHRCLSEQVEEENIFLIVGDKQNVVPLLCNAREQGCEVLDCESVLAALPQENIV